MSSIVPTIQGWYFNNGSSTNPVVVPAIVDTESLHCLFVVDAASSSSGVVLGPKR